MSPPAHPTPASDTSQTSSVLSNLQSQITQLKEQKKVQEQQETQELQSQTGGQTTGAIDPNFVSSKQDTTTPSQPLAGTRDKERQEQATGSPSPERVPIREVVVEFEPPTEVGEWMKVVPNPQSVSLPKPVKDEYGEILIQSTTIPKPNITLPLDEEGLEKAFHHKIADSIRWLAEWCKRTVKLYSGRVFFPVKS